MKHWKRRVCLALVGLFAASCSTSDPIVDGGIKISSVDPSRGPIGTKVVVTGESFVQGMQVCFAQVCQVVSPDSGTRVEVVVPAGYGVVDVSVFAETKSDVLRAGFTYTTEVTGPKVTQMSPTSGKIGVTVTFNGANLGGTTEVCFANQCVAPSQVTADQVRAVVPDGSGNVTVFVVVEGARLNAGVFHYTTASENEIDWCRLTYVPPVVELGTIEQAYAEVYEEGCTPGSATRCAGFRGEIGILKESAGANLNDTRAYAWSPAFRNDGFDGPSSGANDEYMGSLKQKENGLPLEEGTYRVAFRFSTDGVNWTYCDYEGSNAGFSGDRTGRVLVGESVVVPPSVDWCRIMNIPTDMTSKPGEDSQGVYAQAFVPGCTGNGNLCSALKAEIGYGSPALSSIDSIDREFTWKSAQINGGYDGPGKESNNEYMATLKSDVEGEYSVFYRFRVDNGAWKYCDTQDDLGFTPSNAMRWTVKGEEAIEKAITWCRLQSPESVALRANHETPPIYGRAYVASCTGGATQCEGLKAEVGYGDRTKTDFSGFTFVPASFNDKHTGTNNDEFMATLTPAVAGDYALVYRFSIDEGKNWTYCDYSDAMDFSMERAGQLIVSEDKKTIGWCGVQHPKEMTVKVGAKSDPVYGRVYVEGCTEGAAKCDGIRAELGYGMVNDASLASFTYVPATYNDAFTTTNNNEYYASLTVDKEGKYAMIYRFSLDGAAWTYCDYVAAGGFNVANASLLTVEPLIMPISWCMLHSPEYVEAEAGEVTTEIYGRAYVKDCTGGGTKCSDLTGYIGYGPKNGKAEDFTFVPATFNPGHTTSSNDEFVGTLKVSKAGEYALIYAFSQDGGITKTYCDYADDTAFELARAGTLMIKEPPVKSIDWCMLHWPEYVEAEAGQKTTEIYGRAHVKDCTGGGTQCTGLTGYIGYGPKDGKVEDFTFVPATFNSGHSTDANDEFVGTLEVSKAGEYALIYAFSLDGGATKTYCDYVDDTAFNLARSGTMVIKAPFVPDQFIRGKDFTCGLITENYTAAVNAPRRVYGEIWVAGCTDVGSSACSKVASSRVLYAPEDKASEPFTSPHWKTVEGYMNAAIGWAGNNDQHFATLAMDAPGKYRYVFSYDLRESADAVVQRVYCYVDWITTVMGTATITP